ncbi:DUF943 family protein [Enterobacteriaceae bacterium H20N1]|uniref:DUF943 family protein n=1 Tax=Dryocola boscaweniae TaxID=2925397 RepID=A0A9X2W9B6_9ENTR|nr:DUF943 family protein [Dryocola boscaweniae]MCT4702508.1 DUF943 family protein [Dryocola boscaweniae]MCT4719676.1 DUF943 family protein [Dryocola boscaweniae]
MKAKSKKILLILLLFCCALSGYFLWLSLRPVEIVAVHEDGNYSSVLVKNFPFTDKGKINWWLQNKDMLKMRYGIPKPASYGGYDITFWNFGSGYKKEDKYDRICFQDMTTDEKCIEKDAIFSVDKSTNSGTVFTVYNGDNYRLDKNDKVVKINEE